MNRVHFSVMAFVVALLGLGCGDDDGTWTDGGRDPDAASPGPDAASGDGGTRPDGGPPPGEDLATLCDERDHEACWYVSSSSSYPEGTEGRQLVLAEVETTAFDPGDVILFARGDVWRHAGDGPLLSLGSSGTAADWITHGAYGEGRPPSFFGSLAADEWSNVSGDVWESATELADPSDLDYGAEVFFEGADGSALFGNRVDASGDLTAEGDWTFTGGRLRVFSSGSPADRWASVEVPQAARLIDLANQEYVAFDSWNLRYAGNAGFYDRYGNAAGLRGLRVTRSEIGYIGVRGSGSAYGLSLERSDVLVADSLIHDCGRRSISLVLYETEASAIRNVVIERNHFFHGFHTTGVDIQSNQAATGGHTIENITIRHNLFEGDPSYDISAEGAQASNHIYTNEDEGSTLRDVRIYGNIFTYPHGSSIKTSGGSGYAIQHNTFFSFNESYDNYMAHVFLGDRSSDVVLQNNLCHNDAPESRYACIEIGDGRLGELTVDHNLYFAAENAHARLLWVDGGTSWFFDDDWADYVATTGFDESSPEPADPLFVDAPTDLTPAAGSPAVGAGTPIATIERDFAGRPMNDPPDVGALQH